MRLGAVLAILVLSGCGVSYQFQPFAAKEGDFTRQEIVTAFKQRDAILADLTKEVEELKKAKKEGGE